MTKVKFSVIDGDLLCAQFPSEYDPLEASIEKWEFIVNHPEIKWAGGCTTCGLCVKFFDKFGICDGCPVAQAGYYECSNPQFCQWLKDHSTESAENELEFLKSLRKDYNG